MPIFLTKQISPEITLAVWQIKETKQDLIGQLGTDLEDKSKPVNAAETVGIHWFASRVLLQKFFVGQKVIIHKDKNNKPTLYINDEKYFISISHSFEYVGVMVSKTHELGMDIEKIDARIERVSNKFLNEKEKEFANNTLTKTLIWSAKESMYKWYGKKEIDFKLHLLVDSFNPENNTQNFNALLSKNSISQNLDIHYFCIDDYVITYCYS
jgi:hypothetical protein